MKEEEEEEVKKEECTGVFFACWQEWGEIQRRKTRSKKKMAMGTGLYS